MKLYIIASSEENALSRFLKGEGIIEEDVALRDFQKFARYYESLYYIDIPISTRVPSQKRLDKLKQET